MPRPKKEPIAFHLWMPDGRSLCDRRARQRGKYDRMTPEELDKALKAQRNAPACGACLLLVSKLRTDMLVILETTRGKIHPSSTIEAWKSVVGTRWDLQLDLDEFLATPNLEELIRFDASRYEVDQEKIKAGVKEFRAVLDENEKHIRERYMPADQQGSGQVE